jgi:hypothetical protein
MQVPLNLREKLRLIFFLYLHIIKLMAEKVKTFFHIFLNSLLPHYPYYHKLIHTRFTFSLRYFAVFVLATYFLFSTLLAAKLYVRFGLPQLSSSFRKALDSYPADLVVTIKDGKLTSNHDRPYFLWMDHNDKKVLLAVVDESASPEDIYEYNSVVLASANALTIRQYHDRTSITSIPLEGISMIIQKQVVVNVTEKIFQLMLPIFIATALFFVLVVPTLVFIADFFYVVIASILIYFLFKLRLKHLSLQKTLQLSFHATTLPLLINYSLALVGLRTSMVPFAFFILLLIFLTVAVYETYIFSPDHHHSRTHRHS